MMEFSPSSSKKAKIPAGGHGMSIIVSCLVDGCTADLGQCREYHRRHKVCELHSKTPKVTIAGREQRFCQQCSRFHSLVEFDEGKRSCRKRLDGHNRRRRKPQSDPFSKTTTTFLSTQQGIARILSFNNPHIQSSPPMAPAAGSKPQNPIGPFNNQPPLNYLITRHHLSLDSSHPTPTPAPAPQNTGHNHFNFLQHRSLPLNSRALSLLSSSSPPTQQTSTIVPSAAPRGEYGYAQDMLSESTSATTTHQFQGIMFNNDHHANSSSTGGIKHQTLSFRWD